MRRKRRTTIVFLGLLSRGALCPTQKTNLEEKKMKVQLNGLGKKNTKNLIEKEEK